jgi:HPt (histidine-containing phosphotransfer) domain-containing protein/CheY-like chemotaxis protein
MPNTTTIDDEILARLCQEFIESASDQIEEIEMLLENVDQAHGLPEDSVLSIQRNIHNIKGQGATFGCPLTGRVAHMLEDYLENVGKIQSGNIDDIRAYLDLMTDLISSGEAIVGDDSHSVLNALPTGQIAAFNGQQDRDVTVLLVMPAGTQRRVVAKELLSCGFHVTRAYDSIEALSVAVDLLPEIVFINFDLTPFDGRELSNVFASIHMLHDIRIVLLTGYERSDKRLANLPENVSVIEKSHDFTASLGELLAQWGTIGPKTK